MTAEELDREIADVQSVLGALKIIGSDRAEMRGLMERVLALQAERAKVKAEHPAAV